MDARLLFITSHYFAQPTRDALSRLALPCETAVVPYDNFAHIAEVYGMYAENYDACFTSGVIAKQAIELVYPHPSKPLIPFQISPNALHREILRVILDTRSMDLSRIAMDFLVSLDGGWSVADFLNMDEIDSVYADNAARASFIGTRDSRTIENVVLDRIITLWETRQIDLVICQYSSIVPRLQELGIPCRCSFVSDRHLNQLIQDVLVKLELASLHDSHPAIIQIFPRHNTQDSPRQIHQIFTLMQQYVRTNMLDCVVQESDQCCILITSMKILRFLTHDFQECSLSAWLEPRMDVPIAVGYGIGTTVTHAMNNVQIASKEAKLVGRPFIVETNGSMIGPLSSDRHMVISSNTLPDVSDIARRCSLSSMTIHKLLAMVRSNGSDKITTQELASRLGTSLRNANRIMQNLCQGNVAKPVYTQSSHSRGRPIQVYALDFGIPVP